MEPISFISFFHQVETLITPLMSLYIIPFGIAFLLMSMLRTILGGRSFDDIPGRKLGEELREQLKQEGIDHPYDWIEDEPEEEQEPDALFCSYCGSPNLLTELRCVACGAPLRERKRVAA